MSILDIELASDFRPFIFSTDDEAVVPEFMPSNYSDHVLVEVLHSIGICGGYAIPLQESDGRRFVMIYTTSDATRLRDDPQLVLDTMEWFHQRDPKRRLPCASSECPLEGHQFQVLLALARGFTPTQIAGALNVSEFTIREYARLIREETGTKTNAQATARAAQLGWLPYV